MIFPDSWIPYCGAGPVPAEIWLRWNFDPVLLATFALIAWVGWREAPGRRSFAVAMSLALILFVSPFCALGSALFSARVVHHVLLGSVIAPLLVAAFPRDHVRLPGSLGFWTGLQATTFWLWHSPVLYGWALASDVGYWTMQASLLGTAIGFWAALRRASMPAAVAGLLATMVQMGLLGALLTLAGSPLFAPHYLTTAAWGLSPLQDQQLAGLVMWAPAAGFYLAAALLLAGRWIGRDPAPAPAR